MRRIREGRFLLATCAAVFFCCLLLAAPSFGGNWPWDQGHDVFDPDPPEDQDPPPDDAPDPSGEPDPDDPDCGDNPDQPQCAPDYCDQNPTDPLCTDENPDCDEVPSHEKCDPDYCDENPGDPFCSDDPDEDSDEDPDENPNDDPPEDDTDSDPDKPEDDDCNNNGSPFEVVRGGYTYQFTDAEHTYRGPDFAFTRVYSSRSRRNGPMGKGWTHNYDVRLIPVTDGVAVATLCRTGAGKLNRYRRLLDGSYRSPKDVNRNLVEEADGTWTLTDLSGESRRFSADGLLIALRNRRGDEMSFGYDATGFLTDITSASGQTYTLAKGPNGKIASLTDPLNRTFWYDYDAEGNLTHVTNPINEVVEFVYGADGRLAQILDPLSRVSQQLTFDTWGRLESYLEHGEAWTVQYFPSKKKTIKTDPQGGLWKIYYNNNGNVVRRVDPLGGRIHTGYDERRRPSWFVDENGSAWFITYGPAGNVVGITDPLGHTKTHNYDPVTNLRTSTVSPSGRTREYEYDAAGRPTAIRDVLGQLVGYEYDADGLRERQIDANGQAFEFAYDAEDRLSTVTKPGGGVWQLTYDLVGNLTALTDPDGLQLDFVHDGLDRPSNITDGTGAVTAYAYSPTCPVCPTNSLVSSIQDGSGRTQSFVRDAFGRVTESSTARGTFLYSYTPNTNFLETITRPGGQAVTLVPDALRRVDEVQANGASTFYGYDPGSNVTSTTDPLGQLSTFAYDPAGRLAQCVDGETGQTNHGYDIDGNRGGRDDARAVVEAYSFDARGRLATIALPDPLQNVNYAWDEPASANGTGRLTSVNDSGVGVRYHYNVDGELTQEQASIDGFGFATLYQRSPGGRITGMTLPSGIQVDYGLDARGLVQSVGVDDGGGPASVATSITRDAAGRPLSMTLGNGLTETWSYAADGRLLGVTVPGVYDQQLTWGSDGRIANLTSALDAARNRAYGYDSVGRLQSGTGPWGALTFAYDDAGNRVGRTTSSGTDTYQIVDNRLQSINGGSTASYQYDAAGNVVADGSFTYEYDQKGRMIRVAAGGGTVAEYGYNNSNQRLKKTVPGGGTTYYHYDLQGRLIEETDALGNSLRAFVYLDGWRPLAMISDGDIYYYAVDHRHAAQVLTDHTGSVVWSATFYPFGKIWSETGSVDQPLRFPGQFHDDETGLHYNWNRYYDPETGRYLQPDGEGLHGPIPSASVGGSLEYLDFGTRDFAASFRAENSYGYAFSDPVNLVDPNGHDPENPYPFGNIWETIAREVQELVDKPCNAHRNRNDNQARCPDERPADDDPNWLCYRADNPLHQPTPNTDYRGLGPNRGTQCIYGPDGQLRPGDGTYDYSPPVDEDGSHGPFDPTSYDDVLGHVILDVLPSFAENFGWCN